MVLSFSFISPVSQLQSQHLMASHFRWRVEYSTSTDNIVVLFLLKIWWKVQLYWPFSIRFNDTLVESFVFGATLCVRTPIPPRWGGEGTGKGEFDPSKSGDAARSENCGRPASSRRPVWTATERRLVSSRFRLWQVDYKRSAAAFYAFERRHLVHCISGCQLRRSCRK